MSSGTIDRRVRRTRALLLSALLSLVQEKGYDRITIQDILDRADVGRSTFYAHYRDKDELLGTGLRELGLMLEKAQAADLPPTAKAHERIIAFSLAMFEHADEYRLVFQATRSSQAGSIIRNQLYRTVTKLIERELKKQLRGASTAPGIPADLLVHYVASVFICVLNWSLEQPRGRVSPRQVNESFRTLVLPAIARQLGKG